MTHPYRNTNVPKSVQNKVRFQADVHQQLLLLKERHSVSMNLLVNLLIKKGLEAVKNGDPLQL